MSITRRNILPVLFFILLCAGSVEAQDTTHIQDILNDMYPGENLYVGSACHERYLGTQTEIILDNEFNYVTPANEFKQTYIHPEPGIWKWEKSNTWVRHCMENDQIMRLHAPISPQCSKWVKDDSRTAEELDLILTEYMTELCKYYNDSSNIVWLDVVNETISKDGTWFGPREGVDRWENPWPLIGYDESHELRPPIYIKKAFELANEHGSNFKQIINQHGAFEEVVWEKMKKLVLYLRENNIKVDGIGWQAHIDLAWEKETGNLQRLSDFVDWCHANALEFHITEFNVWLREGDELKYQEQSDTFYEIVNLLCSKQENGVIGINFWHIRGVETANPDRDGCPWAEDYQPKPSYFKIKQALIENAPGSSSSNEMAGNDPLAYVYPNPAEDFIYLQNMKRGSDLIIYDQLGNEIVRETILMEKHTHQISTLTPGVYFVTNSINQSKSEVLIVQ